MPSVEALAEFGWAFLSIALAAGAAAAHNRVFRRSRHVMVKGGIPPAEVSAADPSLPAAVIEAAVDIVAPGGQALRQLADAQAAGPGALRAGAPHGIVLEEARKVAKHGGSLESNQD